MTLIACAFANATTVPHAMLKTLNTVAEWGIFIQHGGRDFRQKRTANTDLET